jgi:hypothetical protein
MDVYTSLDIHLFTYVYVFVCTFKPNLEASLPKSELLPSFYLHKFNFLRATRALSCLGFPLSYLLVGYWETLRKWRGQSTHAIIGSEITDFLFCLKHSCSISHSWGQSREVTMKQVTGLHCRCHSNIGLTTFYPYFSLTERQLSYYSNYFWIVVKLLSRFLSLSKHLCVTW